MTRLVCGADATRFCFVWAQHVQTGKWIGMRKQEKFKCSIP
tara:strand:- start:940 stop:1062 length:123 start_codon:yes stop_codon:yes gene_type:complete